MARPKKAATKTATLAAKPKEKKIVMTREQFESLKRAAEITAEARRIINNIDEAESLAAISFAAGRIFEGVNSVEDMLDDLVRDLEPGDSFDDEDTAW